MDIPKIQAEPECCFVDGIPYPKLFPVKNIRSAKAMKPRDSDVFICTYPRSGTTWLQHITLQLLHFDNCKLGEGNELTKKSPMIEMVDREFLETVPNPRLLKSHFDYECMPKSKTAKHIFCSRNPKDVLVSFFHHYRNIRQYNWENGEFDVFFNIFAEGRATRGDYFDHLLGWLENEDELDVLFVRYEDLLEDLEREVIRIADFLGGTAAETASDMSKLASIVESSRFKAMNENQERWFPKEIIRKNSVVRKGIAGNWREYFSREPSEIIDKLFENKCSNTVAAEWWKEEMKWID